MKPERIEYLMSLTPDAMCEEATDAELRHLLSCARAWAAMRDALERVDDIRFAEYDRADVRGVRVEWRVGGVLEGLWDPDLLTATEAALRAAKKENPDAT